MEVECFESDGSSCGRKEVALLPIDTKRIDPLLRSVLLAYQSNSRQGDARTKSRANVSGSGRKPYRQKGTGMARHGEKRSPIWRGGGVVFGSQTKNYEIKINKKMRKKALVSSLSVKAAEGRLLVIKNFSLAEPRTRAAKTLLQNMKLAEGGVLLVDDRFDRNMLLAVRNIPDVYVVEAGTLNALDVCAVSRVVATESALESVLARTNLLNSVG
ncbi:MAG: 50S ribosomal protein L4 [Puniceicoccales bacterium]|nr:50S ribosomal protein L4 [Puniceicoccales bacterium]